MPSILHTTEGTWGRATIYDAQDKERAQDQMEGVFSMQSQGSLRQGLSSASRGFYRSGDTLTSSDDISEDNEGKMLPYFHATLFATILEDTITQVQILVEGNNEIKIIKTMLDMGELVRKKFGVKEPDSVDELEGIDPNTVGSDEHKIHKLDHDRMYVVDVTKRTYIHLGENRIFTALEKSVNDIIEQDAYRAALAEEEARNRILRRDLARQLRQLRNHIKTVLYDSEVRIDGLIAQVEDASLVSECRSRYINNWQRARTEQHAVTIHEKESVYTDSIQYYKQRRDHEHRVHMEVEMLINIAINTILQEIEDMMTKYDGDIEVLQLKIQIKKNEYQDMLNKRVELEETIKKHDEMMKDWVGFKDERERLRLYREKMNKSAIAVQAWWRGLLVRRQLGPYKPKKKKKEPKKK